MRKNAKRVIAYLITVAICFLAGWFPYCLIFWSIDFDIVSRSWLAFSFLFVGYVVLEGELFGPGT